MAKSLLQRLSHLADSVAHSTQLTRGDKDPLSSRIIVSRNEERLKENQSIRLNQAADPQELLHEIGSRFQCADDTDSADLSDVTFREATTSWEVLQCLRKNGLAIFPTIYDPATLMKVQTEYDMLLNSNTNKAISVAARTDTVQNSYGFNLKRNDLSAHRYPNLAALFSSGIVFDIVSDFFSGQTFDYNGDLFVQRTGATKSPASGTLHWDKQLTLKAWLYVTEGSVDHGAMRAALGSAAWTRYAREDAMFDGVPYGKIQNKINEEEIPEVSTGGPAGTFFLFVTDTAHGASSVAEGLERNIIRARSRPHRVYQWQKWAGRQ